MHNTVHTCAYVCITPCMSSFDIYVLPPVVVRTYRMRHYFVIACKLLVYSTRTCTHLLRHINPKRYVVGGVMQVLDVIKKMRTRKLNCHVLHVC